MSTVLFLTDSLAIWICLIQGKAVNVYVETIHPSNGEYKPCSWLVDKQGVVKRRKVDGNPVVRNRFGRQSFVTLVLDSDESEITAHPIQVSGSAWGHRSNTKALRDQLINRFPESIVSNPPKMAQLDTVLVQPLSLTHNQQQWLAKVERTDIVFRNMVMTPEILAKLFMVKSADAYVVVSNILGSVKHVFCRSGRALFVRCFEHLDLNRLVPDLQETLTHLHSSELIDGPISAYTIGLSDELSQSISQLEGIRDTQSFESIQKSGNEHEHESDQYHSVIQLAKQANQHFTKPISKNRKSATVHLNKYRELVLLKKQRVRTAFVLIAGVVSAGSTMSELHQRSLQQAAAIEKIANLRIIVSELKAELLNQSPAGELWSSALMSALSVKNSSAPGPGVLLAMLAQLLSQHENILLDELSWVSFDDDENVLTPDVEESSIDRASPRVTVPMLTDQPSLLLVRLSGRSISSAGLRVRQQSLNALVDELRQQADVSAIRVIESPVQLSSENQALSTAVHESTFQLHFRVRSQFHHDA